MDKKTDFEGKGTSLVVGQFAAFVRGEDWPHEPMNPWRVVAVTAEERYCLACFGERTFDVVQAVTVDGRPVVVARCRCCGAEV